MPGVRKLRRQLIRGFAGGLGCLFIVTGCAFFEPHKIPVQQGNLVNRKALGDVELGMTKEQVAYLLGTPLSVDSFDPDYWVYQYTVRRDERLLQKELVKLRFSNDQLLSIETEGIPGFEKGEDEAAPDNG